MKPMERIVLCWLFFVGWIGLWMTGPETPGDTYDKSAYIVLIAGLVAGVFMLVRAYAIFYRQQNAERLKKVLRNRDARPRR
jgi:hypothetical protein